jgi:hypothetical protein
MPTIATERAPCGSGVTGYPVEVEANLRATAPRARIRHPQLDHSLITQIAPISRIPSVWRTKGRGWRRTTWRSADSSF